MEWPTTIKLCIISGNCLKIMHPTIGVNKLDKYYSTNSWSHQQLLGGITNQKKLVKKLPKHVFPWSHPLRTDTALFFKMNGNNNTWRFIYINTIHHIINPLAVLSKNCLVNTKLIQDHFLSNWENQYVRQWKLSWYHARVAPKLDRLFL